MVLTKIFFSKTGGKFCVNRLYILKRNPPGSDVDDVRDVFLAIRLSLVRAVSTIVPPHEVEDIVQETYVRLCRVGRAERIQHPKSFMFRTARNLALDNVKRAENRLTQSFDESNDGFVGKAEVGADETFNQVASGEEFGHFCEAVRRLPVQARRVFVLKKVYGYSQKEVARKLGLSESTVESHVALAVRRCTKYMKEMVWQESALPERMEGQHDECI